MNLRREAGDKCLRGVSGLGGGCAGGGGRAGEGQRRQGRIFAETSEPRGCHGVRGRSVGPCRVSVPAPPCVSHGTKFSGHHSLYPKSSPGAAPAPSVLRTNDICEHRAGALLSLREEGRNPERTGLPGEALPAEARTRTELGAWLLGAWLPCAEPSSTLRVPGAPCSQPLHTLKREHTIMSLHRWEMKPELGTTPEWRPCG